MSIRKRDRIASSILSGLLGALDSGMIQRDEIVLVLSEVFISYMREHVPEHEIAETIRQFIDGMTAKSTEYGDLSVPSTGGIH